MIVFLEMYNARVKESVMEDNNQIRKIVLIVTQFCNLDCVYCYEKFKSPQNMSFDTAKQIVDSEIKAYGNHYKLTIEFFGGEPFMNFPLIKQVFNYVQDVYKNNNIRFCTTTNGTMLVGEIREFLSINKDIFECSLSLDGTEKMHNLNRCYPNGQGSYNSINTDFFLENYREPRAKMTISKETLPYLFEGVVYVESLGFVPICDLASGADYWDIACIEILHKQLQLLVDYYSQNSNSPICRMLDYNFLRIFIPQNAPFKYCGAGKNMVTYDVDGTWYPCMALAPVSQGKEAVRFANENFSTFCFDDGNPCKMCKLLRLCRNCYAVNYNQTGDTQRQTGLQCLINRMTISAGVKIQFNRITRKYHSSVEISHEDQMVLEALLRVNDALSEDIYLKVD